MDDDDLDFTKGNIPPPTNNAILNAPTQKMELEGVKELPVDSGVSGFTNSKLVSIEMVDSLGDSDLQDAAMRFAEGDDVGAEAVLLSIVQAEEKFPGSADPCAAALFDMYRSLGNKQRFESAAMEYAQRFGRSPPEWYSPADLPPVQSGPVTETLPAVGRVSAPAWECPSLLDLDAVRRLRSILLTAEMPWHVSWGQLADVSAPAAPELEDLFRQWCVSAIQLRFDGAHVLERVLKSKTPSDDPQVDQIWWRVRLDALRILQLHDDFEEAALDFCLVYELSPPSWIPAQCQLHDRPTHQEVMDSGWGRMSNFMAELAPPVLLALSGELVGDCSDTLAAVLKLPKDPSERVVVSCARLVRVDFTSAGAILNWATECESIGSRVQFTDVPRLVAAFFGVIGINEYAKLGLRSK